MTGPGLTQFVPYLRTSTYFCTRPLDTVPEGTIRDLSAVLSDSVIGFEKVEGFEERGVERDEGEEDEGGQVEDMTGEVGDEIASIAHVVPAC